MNDCRQSIKFLKNLNNTNQKIGIIGTCSGGRHAYLAACTLEGIDAAVDCWGGRVTAEPDELTAAQPKAPIDYTEQLNCPLLGIFGNDDHSPSAKQVDQLEATLKKYHKSYQFYRYDNAGHGFWYYHTDLYRPQQAMDSWEKVLTFFHEQLRNNT
ncbi:hypothetical protein SDC9_177816 [bioreactor metagenome]|uniref:Dienelactone hydrolase domain-containing protein n=1 Tax=bioreactor metagenome TaxID=1076179 RepID=A0A645GU97_9ZZZZ